MSNDTNSIAHQHLRAFIERIERLEEERKAIASDIAEVYAEAKGNGFDRKAIKAVVRIRSMDADVRMEHEALVALYLSALGMGSALDFEDDDRASHVHVHMHAREELPAHDPETGEIDDTAETPNEAALAPAKAGTARQAEEEVRASSAAHSEAAGELVAPGLEAADHGSATDGGEPPKGTNPGGEDVGDRPVHVPEEPGRGAASVNAPAEGGTYSAKISEPVEGAPDRSGEPVPPNHDLAPVAPSYAAPGIVVSERTPPVGIAAHPYAACWPVNNVNVSGGVREPIVKIEHFILDGRGRYFAARDAGIEYPVVQYDGADALLDCIRLNLASRSLTEAQRRNVAHKLSKIEPDRADEIMAAFGLTEELVAAE